MAGFDDDLAALHGEFAAETLPLCHDTERLLSSVEDGARRAQADWAALLEHIHTMKGSFGMMRYRACERLAHAMEAEVKAARDAGAAHQARTAAALLAANDALRAAIPAPAEVEQKTLAALAALSAGTPPAESPVAPRPAPRDERDVPRAVSHVRIPSERLDRLLELVGELVTLHHRLSVIVAELAETETDDDRVTTAFDVHEQLGRSLADIRAGVLESRLLPLSLVLSRFAGLGRELATRHGKRVRVRVTGTEIVVDKSIIDRLYEPLVHVFRNAIDHGLEPSEARARAGKPETGDIAIHAHIAGSELVVLVEDDGRGIDADALVRRARDAGLDVAGLPSDDVLELVFEPELSTAGEVSELSGRGVGLSSARRVVQAMSGSIAVRTRPGRGTTFEIRVPLALALRRMLLVGCAGETFALPITAVSTTVRVVPARLERSGDTRLLRWRDRLLVVHDLAHHMDVPRAVAAPETRVCVIVGTQARYAGLLVDSLDGQQDVIVRDLDAGLGQPEGISGAAILGDGRVAMVLDPSAMTAPPRRGAAKGAA